MKKNHLLMVATLVLLALALTFFPLAVLYGRGLVKSASSLAESVAAALQNIDLDIPESGQEPATFLLYGIDAGEWPGETYRPGTGRADTIVLIKAYPALKAVSILSIPRDTLVEIPGRPGDDKINHAYAFGQAHLLIETVELFTGVPVDYYVGLDYLAFKDIVDVLGGVEFDVDKTIHCRGLVLQPGLQVLDGDAAFALVSDRQEALGDIGRVKRQQRFMKAVGDEVKTRTLDDIFYTVLAGWKNVNTNLKMAEVIRLNRALNGIKDEDIHVDMVPGWFYNRSGISYWRPDLAETEIILDRLFFNFMVEEGSRDEDAA